MQKPGFDNERYLSLQSEKIRERIGQFGGKLYLEFGGKLFDDYHASRVLPGFLPDSKVKMLLQLKDTAEIVIVINAGDIERSKMRGDLGITYDQDVLRLIDAFSGIGLLVGSVVITHYSGQAVADTFIKRLKNFGVNVFKHYYIAGYPADLPLIVSDGGFGKNDYITTTRELVVVTAPGPGSGKMAVCLSQLYHEHQRGTDAGYAKFETFPVWNLPLKHPVNLAYEAATADLDDVNMLDPFHLEAYGAPAVNYNRDVEIFPVLKAILERVSGTCPYNSPTDMGVNMAGYCIDDDALCRRAAQQEILRRYYAALCAQRQGVDDGSVYKLELLLKQAGIDPNDRSVVAPALQKAEQTGEPAMALELPDGSIVTGKTSPLLGAASAMLLNALKKLGNIHRDIHLISPIVLEPIQALKIRHLGNRNPRLHTDETLIALCISAATNPTADIALQMLQKLRGCEAHSTVILSPVDVTTFQKLGIHLTMEPRYENAQLYHR